MTECENCKTLQAKIDILKAARINKFTIPKSWVEEDLSIKMTPELEQTVMDVARKTGIIKDKAKEDES